MYRHAVIPIHVTDTFYYFMIIPAYIFAIEVPSTHFYFTATHLKTLVHFQSSQEKLNIERYMVNK